MICFAIRAAECVGVAEKGSLRRSHGGPCSSCAPARCPCIRLRPRNSRTRAVPCVRLPGKREKCQYHITEFVSHPEKSRIQSMSVAHGLAVHGISVMRADRGEDMFGKSN